MFRYTTRWETSPDNDKLLNEMGKDGWRLVCINYKTEMFGKCWCYVFEKKLTEITNKIR